VDATIFRRWAQLMHRRSDHDLQDALIAAAALVRGLTAETPVIKDEYVKRVKSERVRSQPD
jgi:predicted nucleic acid-binding protein